MNLERLLALAALFLVAAEFTMATMMSDSTEGKGRTTVVKMVEGNRFEPESVIITVGDTVEWVNADQNTIHTATAVKDLAKYPNLFHLPEGAKPFDSGGLTPGQKFEHQFTVTGTYKYFCVPHQPKMRGTIVVKPRNK